MGLQVDVDAQPDTSSAEPDLPVDKASETLNPVEDRLNVQLNSWSPGFGFCSFCATANYPNLQRSAIHFCARRSSIEHCSDTPRRSSPLVQSDEAALPDGGRAAAGRSAAEPRSRPAACDWGPIGGCRRPYRDPRTIPFLPTNSATEPNDPDLKYAFELDGTGDPWLISTRITGGVSIAGEGAAGWDGSATFVAKIDTVTLTLTQYDNDGNVMDTEQWSVTGLRSEPVTISKSSGAQNAIFDLGIYSHAFKGDKNEMELPGTFSLAWEATALNWEQISAGVAKSVELSNGFLDVEGTVIPEAQEFALIAGLGLAAFAGWRRMRT